MTKAIITQYGITLGIAKSQVVTLHGHSNGDTFKVTYDGISRLPKD